MLNALSVDVEDYFHASSLSRYFPRDTWDSLEHRVGDNTSQLLDLLDETQTSGTFFVLGWVAERYPEIVRNIDRRGHEVACHGYSHRLIYDQSIAEFESETRLAKDILEQIIGKPVIGYRGASFSVTEKSRWALETIASLGFIYDSSIYPVRHDRYGIRSESILPRVHDLKAGKLVEVPPGVLEVGKFRLPIGGGGYFRLFPYSLTRTAVKRANKNSTPFVFYIHPWEIDEGQPRAVAKWHTKFRHYTNISKVGGRLSQLLSEFQFAPVCEVLRSGQYMTSGSFSAGFIPTVCCQDSG